MLDTQLQSKLNHVCANISINANYWCVLYIIFEILYLWYRKQLLKTNNKTMV